MTLAVFIVALAAIAAVGLASAFRSKGTRLDYYLASRKVPPALVGLSAVATNNSGYMFIGVIGFTYAVGLSAFWLMFGWIVGDYLTSLHVHRRVREQGEARDAVTFGGLLSRWGGTDYKVVRRVSAIVTLAFLGSYAAAQLSAGGKALHAVFGWNEDAGAFMVATVVAAITHDIGERPVENRWWIKTATLGVVVLALGIALAQPESVFNLVILSWSALASAFGPLLIVYAAGRKVSERLALAMIFTGPLVAVMWRELGWHNSIYEGLPGMLAGLALYGAVAAMRGKDEPVLKSAQS